MGIDNVFRKPIEAGLIPGIAVLAADALQSLKRRARESVTVL
jgi:hypothetical protein